MRLEIQVGGVGLRLSPWFVFTVFALTASAAFINWTYHGQVAKQLDRIETQETNELLTHKWTSGGDEVSYTTTRGEHDPTETVEQHSARHKAEVATHKLTFPVDT